MNAELEMLFHWVCERELIRQRKERGDPHPWTTDPILGKYRFCCVRREDDRVTRWVHDCVRAPYADHPSLWLMLCLCRQINWPATLGELIDHGAWPGVDDFPADFVASVLAARKARGDKVYTGAYVIAAPAERGADKQRHIAKRVLGSLWERRSTLLPWRSATLQGTHAWLRQSSGWGDFMAYQAVVDMRFCDNLLAGASDVQTWAAAGPGTIRGLNRIAGRDVDAKLSQDHALREVLALWPLVMRETSVGVDLSDVPNILCETDKYIRVKNREGTPRSLYVPGRGC